MTTQNAFKYFKTSPIIIRLAVMYYIRYPLSFRQVEDILHERGIDICHETVRFWVNRFGAKFAKEIRKKRVGHHSNWQWHLDEVFVKINGEKFYLWRAVDHEGEVLECFVTKRRNKAAAKKFLIKTMRKHGAQSRHYEIPVWACEKAVAKNPINLFCASQFLCRQRFNIGNLLWFFQFRFVGLLGFSCVKVFLRERLNVNWVK